MDISIDQYNYHLPEDRIARYPLNKRDHSKLLCYEDARIKDSYFYNLPDLLPRSAMMIFNNTRVIRARLPFRKKTGAGIEIFCLEPCSPADVALAFAQTKEVTWNCMIGNAKKWKEGVLEKELQAGQNKVILIARKVQETSDGFAIRFEWNNPDYSFSELMEEIGKTPIPPYLERESEDIDTERYQTVYSEQRGSVAAPTAGLHFTPETLQNLKNNGVKLESLTLHVGAGTFRPVKSDTIADHEMHTEHFRISLETLKAIRDHCGPRISVGTTSLRTLESLHWAGALAALRKPFHHIEQWTPYQTKTDISFNEAIDQLISAVLKEGKNHFEGSTAIIIVPGYRIKAIDALLTNFHQPKSTLLLLVAALVGDKWKNIYNHALANDYRFLSYGDSSLLWASHLP